MNPMVRYRELKEELKRSRSPLQVLLDTLRSEAIGRHYKPHWQDKGEVECRGTPESSSSESLSASSPSSISKALSE